MFKKVYLSSLIQDFKMSILLKSILTRLINMIFTFFIVETAEMCLFNYGQKGS